VAPLESLTPKRVRGCEGMFPLQSNRVLGRVVQAAQQVRGRALAENGFGEIGNRKIHH